MGTHAEARDTWLDLYGGHDNSSCGPTSHGKHKGHTLLKYVIHRFAGMVPGVKCVVEPQTHDVLLGQFSKTQCRKLFPKRPSKERAAEIKKLVDELDEVSRLPEGDLKVPGRNGTNERTEYCKYQRREESSSSRRAVAAWHR